MRHQRVAVGRPAKALLASGQRQPAVGPVEAEEVGAARGVGGSHGALDDTAWSGGSMREERLDVAIHRTLLLEPPLARLRIRRGRRHLRARLAVVAAAGRVAVRVGVIEGDGLLLLLLLRARLAIVVASILERELVPRVGDGGVDGGVEEAEAQRLPLGLRARLVELARRALDDAHVASGGALAEVQRDALRLRHHLLAAALAHAQLAAQVTVGALQVGAVLGDGGGGLRDAHLDAAAQLVDQLAVDGPREVLPQQPQLDDPVAHRGDALADRLALRADRDAVPAAHRLRVE
mmetsp:Transcript_16796/g.44205  ORF Transcript_16796/g.44205 Transcript_16796/m.44205 type:complete len:292 (+) Transcript_16796:568-1443(+)